MKISLSNKLFLVLFFLTLNLQGAEGLFFKNKGKFVKELSFETLSKDFEIKELNVYEPHEKKELIYKGFWFNSLLDKVYGKDWKEKEELLFTCKDGYQPSIGVFRFIKEASFLAFEKVGSKDFTLVNQLHNGEKVDLSPFYLVWDNLKAPNYKIQPPLGWPYQLIGVDLILFSENFPKLAPPDKSSVNIKKGFMAFRERCLSCHRINGQGGARAVELNYPVSVTETFKERYLRQWILSPSSIRFDTTMPAFNQSSPKWKEDFENILSYLKVMAKNKQKP